MSHQQVIRVSREAVREHGRIVGYLTHRDSVTVPDVPPTAARAASSVPPPPLVYEAASLSFFAAPDVFKAVAARQYAVVHGLPIPTRPVPPAPLVIQWRQTPGPLAHRLAFFTAPSNTLALVVARQKARGRL